MKCYQSRSSAVEYARESYAKFTLFVKIDFMMMANFESKT